MQPNRFFEIKTDNSNSVKYLGSTYKDINNTLTSYKGFRLMEGFRYMGGEKFKKSYIAIKGSILIGTFSKIKGLKENIDLFLKN